MKVFVACSYSDNVNYDTGEVFPAFKTALEETLRTIEKTGATVFNALRYDKYKINDLDPAEAFFLDKKHLDESDVLVVLLDDKISAGAQVEIGYAIAKNKQVILAHQPGHKLAYFNAAMIKGGVVKELELPITADKLTKLLGI